MADLTPTRWGKEEPTPKSNLRLSLANIFDQNQVTTSEFQNFVRVLDKSLLFREIKCCGYQLIAGKAIKNQRLTNVYDERKHELASSSTNQGGSPSLIGTELYGFYLTSSDEEVYNLALKGLSCLKTESSNQNKIGSSLYGVQLEKHLDVALLRQLMLKTRSVNCVLVKFCINKFCLVKPNSDSCIFPHSQFDAHFPLDIPSPDDPIEKIWQNSLIYLYEFDSVKEPIDTPRNILPLVWLKFKFDSSLIPWPDFFSRNQTMDESTELNVDIYCQFDDLYVTPSKWRVVHERIGSRNFKLKNDNELDHLNIPILPDVLLEAIDANPLPQLDLDEIDKFLALEETMEEQSAAFQTPTWTPTDMKEVNRIKRELQMSCHCTKTSLKKSRAKDWFELEQVVKIPLAEAVRVFNRFDRKKTSKSRKNWWRKNARWNENKENLNKARQTWSRPRAPQPRPFGEINQNRFRSFVQSPTLPQSSQNRDSRRYAPPLSSSSPGRFERRGGN